MQFGQRIRELRERKKLLQRQIAYKLEVDTPMYSKIERGDRKARRDQVMIIAEILGEDKDELISLWLADQVLELINAEPTALVALNKASNLYQYPTNTKAVSSTNSTDTSPTSSSPGNEGQERYQLMWTGKSNAYKNISNHATTQLKPCPELSINWKRTRNILVEGDNLEALKNFQKDLSGKIKGIYIDPPYNTGSDNFIYKDSFKKSAKSASSLKAHINTRTGSNTDAMGPSGENGKYHSQWLSMMLPRLFLARNLLRDDGVIFVSVDDNELANLRLLMDEVYGENNFIDIFSWAKSETPANLSKKSKKVIEYVLCYQKIKNNEKFKGIHKTSKSSNGLLNQSNKMGTLHFPAHIVSTKIEDCIIPKGKYGTNHYDIHLLQKTEVKDGVFIKPVILQAKFKWTQAKLDNEIAQGTKIMIPTLLFSPSYEKLAYDEEVPPNLINSKVGVGTNENASSELSELFGAKVFDFPKPPSLIKYLFHFSDDPDGIFIDFFAGSGATAQAVLEMNHADAGNRQYICVQLAEEIDKKSTAYAHGFRKISEITRQRLLILHDKYAKDETVKNTYKLDTGFKYYKLTEMIDKKT